jgi:hypothetical protein
MTGVGLGKGFGSLGYEVSGKEFGSLYLAEFREIQADFLGELPIENHELRLADRGGGKLREKDSGQCGIGALERNGMRRHRLIEKGF